jgi:hypothetical protein
VTFHLGRPIPNEKAAQNGRAGQLTIRHQHLLHLRIEQQMDTSFFCATK